MNAATYYQSIADRISAITETRFDRSSRETAYGVLFAIPYLAVFAVFLFYPLVKGLYMSLYDWNMLVPSETTFIGLDNYIRMFSDPAFWNAMVNTFVFVALTVPLLVIVSLALALGVNRGIKGQRILTTIFFIPYILPVSVAALVFLYMLAEGGVITTYVLGPLLGGSPLDSELWALPAIVITTVWWKVGFFFAVLLAARQSVPERLYEAAKLDGAGSWRMFWDISVPQMRHAILFVVITSFINQFQVFGQPFVMTKGGPVGATQTIVYYLYSVGFQRHEFGFAAAVGYVLLVILVGVSIFNYKFIGTTNE